MENTISYLAKLSECDTTKNRLALQHHIGYLFRYRTEKLLWILYRLDVDEQKLYQALEKSIEPEEKIITDLLLKRCAEILKNRTDKDFNSTERWSFDLED